MHLVAGCNPSMVAGEKLASVAPLANGEVLIAGGFALNGLLNKAELYNPQAGSFASVADLLKARQGN